MKHNHSVFLAENKDRLYRITLVDRAETTTEFATHLSTNGYRVE